MNLIGDKLYYAKENKVYTLYDFVNDSGNDEKVEMPVWEDYAPDIKKYQTETVDPFWGFTYTETDYDAYYDAVDAAEEKYDAAYDKYNAVKNRENLRENLNTSI